MIDSYFFDDGPECEAQEGNVHLLARRQFVFSIIVGALLIFCAALIGARSYIGAEPPLALDRNSPEAPAAAEVPANQG
jgi:hypothetical protein